MRKIFFVLASFVFLPPFFPTSLLWADCVNLARYNSYVVENDKRIVFYRGSSPIAAVTLQDCSVKPQSDIRLTTPYMCGSDKLIIAGEECSLLSLDSME